MDDDDFDDRGFAKKLIWRCSRCDQPDESCRCTDESPSRVTALSRERADFSDLLRDLQDRFGTRH
jgi:hypothetical protein